MPWTMWRKTIAIRGGFRMSKKTIEILWLILWQLKNQHSHYKAERNPIYSFYYKNEIEKFIQFPSGGSIIPLQLVNNNYHFKTS
jgi:hypothetical protein